MQYLDGFLEEPVSMFPQIHLIVLSLELLPFQQDLQWNKFRQYCWVDAHRRSKYCRGVLAERLKWSCKQKRDRVSVRSHLAQELLPVTVEDLQPRRHYQALVVNR